MLVREVITDAKTGEVTERMVDMPDVMTLDEGLAATAVAAQQAANEQTIGQQVDTALANNAAYLAITAPANAQVAAQVKALTRQTNGIIRLMRRKLDATT